jgi:hypothetical protein
MNESDVTRLRLLRVYPVIVICDVFLSEIFPTMKRSPAMGQEPMCRRDSLIRKRFDIR